MVEPFTAHRLSPEVIKTRDPAILLGGPMRQAKTTRGPFVPVRAWQRCSRHIPSKGEASLTHFNKQEASLIHFNKQEASFTHFNKQEASLAHFNKLRGHGSLAHINKQEASLTHFNKQEASLAHFNKHEAMAVWLTLSNKRRW